MNKTKIEYLDYTWNPLAMRCTPVSEGCANCWHISMAKRLAGNPKIPKNEREAYASGNPVLRQKELEAPLHLKKPFRIGMQFMGDLFHENIKPEWIDEIWEVMAACHQHTFIVLTKRPQNIERLLYGVTEECGCRELGGGDYLSNAWLGVSIENQRTADKRIPILLQIPATKRFVSVEPLLSSVDLSSYFPKWRCMACGKAGFEKEVEPHGNRTKIKDGIDWCIVGGETGPKARPMDPDWVRSLRDQCKKANVSFFFKQMSAKQPIPKDLMIREFPK
jgi:protein gp37